MQVAFIGLGNVGGKLAGNLVRSEHALVVHDLNRAAAEPLIAAGAGWSDSPAQAAGLDWDQKIQAVLVPATQPWKELMFIPALLLLALIVLMQRKRSEAIMPATAQT